MLDIDGEVPELRSLATYYADLGGALWLADDASGMIATRPGDAHAWEICRVYVHPDRHGFGLAADLLAHAERHARDHGATSLYLWSDTRFTRAHRFYAKHGYVDTGHTRALHDFADTVERRFEKHPLPAPASATER